MPKTVGVAVSNATFHFDKLYTYAVNGIGVQFIKMEGRVAYGNTHRFWHGHGLLCGLIYCAIPARRQMT